MVDQRVVFRKESEAYSSKPHVDVLTIKARRRDKKNGGTSEGAVSGASKMIRTITPSAYPSNNQF